MGRGEGGEVDFRRNQTTGERGMTMCKPLATGFDFEPLPDGNVLIEFFGDDGKTFNTQVITGEAFSHMPMAAYILRRS